MFMKLWVLSASLQFMGEMFGMSLIFIFIRAACSLRQPPWSRHCTMQRKWASTASAWEDRKSFFTHCPIFLKADLIMSTGLTFLFQTHTESSSIFQCSLISSLFLFSTPWFIGSENTMTWELLVRTNVEVIYSLFTVYF